MAKSTGSKLYHGVVFNVVLGCVFVATSLVLPATKGAPDLGTGPLSALIGRFVFGAGASAFFCFFIWAAHTSPPMKPLIEEVYSKGEYRRYVVMPFLLWLAATLVGLLVYRVLF